MSTLLNYYSDGTVSVSNGSKAVVGSGTSWASIIRSGDIFAAQGLTVRINSVTDNNDLVLADVWPGDNISGGDYEIRLPPPSADVTTGIRQLVESLNGGVVDQLESLAPATGDLIQYNGSIWENVSVSAIAATVGPVLSFPVGTVSAPSINFSGDTNTGIYHPAADSIGFVANGVQVAGISTSGFGIRSTGTGAFDLLIKNTENLTAARALTITLGDAARTLALGGNLTTGNALAFTQTGATTLILPTSGTVATLANSETLQNKSISGSSNTITNLTTAMFAAAAYSTDTTLASDSDTIIPSQKAIKSYIDNAVQGLQWKTAVQCATTANITLSGEQTIDGVTTSASRVLVINQTTASQNGIYVSGSGAWTRSLDMTSAAQFPSATVFVEGGTTHSDTQWTCTNNATITVGTTSITFAQVSGAGTYSAGSGLTLTGNSFSIASSAITYAKIQNVTAARLLGNPTGSAAAPSEISLGSTLAFNSTTLQTAALTGDVTATANSFVTAIAAIQGTAVSGQTGTGNVVFSASSTLTGTTVANALALGGAAIGSNALSVTGSGVFSTSLQAASIVSTSNVTAAAGNAFIFSGRTKMSSSADGKLTLINNAGTGFTSIQLGGTTSSFPEIKNASGILAFRLADNSADASISANSLTLSGTLNGAAISGGSNTITNLATTMFGSGIFSTDSTFTSPSDTVIPSQKAVATYVNSLIQGLSWKQSVACATTANITLSGEQTIDGVVTSGSRVLVKNQTTASQNGLYVSSSSTWQRTVDANTGTELAWATVLVEGGTTQARTQWTVTNATINLGTDNVVIAQMAGGGGSGVYSKTDFTATSGQTVFTVTYTVGYTDVWKNGTKLTPTQFTATNGTSITLTSGATTGDIVEVVSWNITSVSNFVYVKTPFTATSGQTSFSVNYTVGYVDVWRNGTKLAASQYTATTGTAIVLGTAAYSGDIIEIVAWNTTTLTIPSFASTVTFADGGAWGASGISGLTKLGIGMTPTNVLDITQNQNNVSNIGLSNNSSGTAAGSRLELANNVSANMSVMLLGGGYTSTGMYRADGAMIRGDGAGGLTLMTGTNQPIYFGKNSTEYMRLDTNGYLLVGYSSNVADAQVQVNGNVFAGNYDAAPAGFGAYTSDGFSFTGSFSASGISTTYGGFTVTSVSGGVILNNGATSWASNSVRAKKKNFKRIENPLDIVSNIRAELGHYTYEDDDAKLRPFVFYEDAEVHWPHATQYRAPHTATMTHPDRPGETLTHEVDEFKGVSYELYVPLILAALHEQIEINKTVTTRLATIEATLDPR